MKVSNCALAEIKLIELFKHSDARGSFVKTFNTEQFKEVGIEFKVAECFYSTNAKGVLRGMHYHTPPMEHAKIVYCTAGSILDVAVDIRKHSPSFGKYVHVNLDAQSANALYIPKGFAHGFLTLSNVATVCYMVDGIYSAAHDAGIAYNSFGMEWPTMDLIISDRDKGFIKLKDL
jgi:dTDP-4-dehydrorhamnose 3,5-epimerase